MGNPIRTALAVGACKSIQGILRRTKHGGTTLPGKAAMAFDKNILEEVSRGMEVILVTGTNGKTTTCRMICQAMEASGFDTLTNTSGANLLPGVVAEFTANASLSGKPRSHYAVIECDEGALKQIVPLVHPKVILVTNLFRDQLDRYGEITHTLEEIRIACEKAPESTLCLNADCSLTSSLGEDLPNKVVYYGLDISLEDPKAVDVSDARYCLRCGTEYSYTYHTYAHLGSFRCPSCGYHRKDTQVAVTESLHVGIQGTSFRLAIRDGEKEISAEARCALAAVYNIYNAAATIGAFVAAGYDTSRAIPALADVTSSFGRMENFDLDGVPLQMILIKNPAGCNQALAYLSEVEEERAVALCLNDRTGDGHDISWIWDADYERLCTDARVRRVYISGDRAEEMSLRLKYGGIDTTKIELVQSDGELIERMRVSEVPVFILPNYTAMLSLRVALGEITGKRSYWDV